MTWLLFDTLQAIDSGELEPLPYKVGTRGPEAVDEMVSESGYVKESTYVWHGKGPGQRPPAVA